MTTETQTPTRKVSTIDEVKSTLISEPMKKQFAMALPPHIPLERFVRVAMTAMTGKTGQDLVQCTKESLYGAFMGAAQDGLLPDGREAAIVKFGDTAQYMPMTKGILKKVRNSGELGMFHVELIHEKDEFTYYVDENGPHLNHKPEVLGSKGKEIGVYAIAKTKDGEAYIEVMNVEEVEEVRSISRAKSGPAWTNWWGEMAKKTVIRRLSKRLPMSTDLDDLIRRDDAMYDVEAKVSDTKPESKGKKGEPNRLQKMLSDTIEGVGHTVGESAGETPTTIDPEEDARIKARQAELDAQKEQLKNAPDAEEQEQIRRREEFESFHLQCVKCPPLTFGTNDANEMKRHMEEKHTKPVKAEEKKPANGGAKQTSGGGLFGG
jgi:recombination protein RecT